ncbi:MGMT family protein [Umezawaea tangerina]|uniref:O(6)-alkylguanine repair protein YbaZ n=1 Tax=Umezawaea tangerina TaxID=84725 RepID=A0A2T0TMC4_9PSEU|nr:MGMT family protein [Umezawaea tangerina]PRY46872.1 O(6)-alkylguanine repair protein YbaZ [Umezawaea tangerina]
MDELLHEMIRDTIRKIPAGRVATYGDIADLSHAPTAKLVGHLLNTDHTSLPWHRVLRANGTCAPHIAEEQLRLLEEEGVPSTNGKINLHTYRWEEAVKPQEEDNTPTLF